jgi:aspartyl-tRNA(Asn)/glutamyl-tRNA(Gln) amidotransferase subunit B
MPGHRRPIGITRIHMEVDAGKNLHEGIPGASWVDLNRTGIPLMEIVSEPDLRSSAEAVEYLKNLRAILRYLQVCDGNMEEGSFRCDANVSVRPMGSSQLGTRCELKNLNSIRHVARAIDHEVMRQIDLIESGGCVVQETRLWDTQQNVTRSMRSKEEAHDYRYFPEPDLPPLRIEPERIERLQLTLPELPDARRARFEQQYGLPASDAGVLVSARELADFYEQAVEQTRAIPAQEAQPDDLKQRAKLVANWVTGDLLAALNKDNLEIDASPVTAGQLASLIGLIQQGIISGKIAKEIFGHMLIEGGTPESWVDRLGLRQLSDTSALAEAVDRVLQETPDEVQRYRAGQVKLLAFFVGRVMKATQGKANPGEVNRLLKERLGS